MVSPRSGWAMVKIIDIAALVGDSTGALLTCHNAKRQCWSQLLRGETCAVRMNALTLLTGGYAGQPSSLTASLGATSAASCLRACWCKKMWRASPMVIQRACINYNQMCLAWHGRMLMFAAQSIAHHAFPSGPHVVAAHHVD
eukprot:TRINITY_DN12141_c1_g1_i2.p2 TRINITY_DN12141_c1_g1~~TRINITY_DN12141_c1_g1_i2.p2  ORF type:complete len:142 (+),score=12.22 TRINITY_DN12141_c1_g1_i2:1436-1861(+)